MRKVLRRVLRRGLATCWTVKKGVLRRVLRIGPSSKVTEPNLRFPVAFCEDLRFSAQTLRFSTVSCTFQMLEPCPSFPWSFRKYQGKPQKCQGFFSPCEPSKTLENKQKTLKKTKEFRSKKNTKEAKTPIRRVPTTPDPNTSEKVSRYKWEAYRDTNWWCIYYFLPRGGHTFSKICHRNRRCIAILFKSIGVRGCFDFPEPKKDREFPGGGVNLRKSSSAKWWFSLRMIWGFWGPGFRTLWQSSVRPRTLLRCPAKWSRQRRDASPQSTCRAERNPGPRKPQIRNVQIRNLAVLGKICAVSCWNLRFGLSVTLGPSP